MLVSSSENVQCTDQGTVAIILRVYKTWDRRRHTTYVLTIAFLLSVSAATVLVIMSTLEVQCMSIVQISCRPANDAVALIHYNPLIHTCAFFDIPGTIPYLLGVLVSIV